MILLLLLCAADVRDSSDNIRDLKATERNLLDEIDERIKDRRALQRQARTLEAQLTVLEQSAANAAQRLEADSAAYERAETDARKRARQMDKLMRGQAARFVLGADGIAEGIKRTRIIERAFRRDAQLLMRALKAVDARKTIVAALEADRRQARELVTNANVVQKDIETSTKELALALTEIRGKRSNEERQFYDLREFEARLQREAEEENVAATDPFVTLKGRLHWPVAGAVRVDLAGVGIDAPAGAGVTAVADGVVTWVGPVRGYDLVVMLRHSSNYTGIYGGLASVSRALGDHVLGGAPLGIARQGEAHFELRRHEIPENAHEWMEPR